MAPRLEHAKREDIPQEDLASFESVVETLKGFYPDRSDEERLDGGPYWGNLLHSPPLCEVLLQTGRLLSPHQFKGLTEIQRELTCLAAVREIGWNYDFNAHAQTAVASGVRPEAVVALWHKRDGDLTAGERAVAQHARAVARGDVSDETFEAARAEVGERGVVECTVYAAFVCAMLRLFNAFGVPDPAESEVEGLVDRLAGK